MSDVYGVKYTKTNNPIPDNLFKGWGSSVRCSVDIYECDSTASGTVIYLGKLPKGAYVLPTSKLYHDALGANTTLKIGIVGDDALFSAAESTSSAGNIELDAIGSIGVPMTADSNVIATLAYVATGTVKLDLIYGVL